MLRFKKKKMRRHVTSLQLFFGSYGVSVAAVVTRCHVLLSWCDEPVRWGRKLNYSAMFGLRTTFQQPGDIKKLYVVCLFTSHIATSSDINLTLAPPTLNTQYNWALRNGSLSLVQAGEMIIWRNCTATNDSRLALKRACVSKDHFHLCWKASRCMQPQRLYSDL